MSNKQCVAPSGTLSEAEGKSRGTMNNYRVKFRGYSFGNNFMVLPAIQIYSPYTHPGFVIQFHWGKWAIGCLFYRE